MQKAYSRINWENYPSEETPLNASNLNRIDSATNEIDDRVIAFDTEKANVTDLANLVRSIALDDETGIITITKYNGSTATIQTTIDKIAVNFSYDYTNQKLLIELNDGTTQEVDLSSFIQNNEFTNSNTIGFTVNGSLVSAEVLDGSITDAKLRTDYLADIRVEVANAQSSAGNADLRALDSEAWAVGQRDSVDVPSTDTTYKNNSKWYANRSKSWAVGGTGIRTGEDTDNSKYYSEAAAVLKTDMEGIKAEAQELLDSATARLTTINFMVNYADGCLYYDLNSGLDIEIDYETGNLMWEVIT